MKRTILFSRPGHFSGQNEQLIVRFRDDATELSLPTEDLALIVIEHPQSSLTQFAITLLAKYNVGVIFCDQKYLPVASLFLLDSHQIQNERYRAQVKISEPTKKQLWAETIKYKIANQASLLEQRQSTKAPRLRRLERDVKSGDTTNCEAQAARIYWSELFGKSFARERNGVWPNALLNYGYTILRATAARALAGAGLLPTLGIHHHNRYNHYPLADDLMEPFRPFVDRIVLEIISERPELIELDKAAKAQLLVLHAVDVVVNNNQSTLLTSINSSATAMAQRMEGQKTPLPYPKL